MPIESLEQLQSRVQNLEDALCSWMVEWLVDWLVGLLVLICWFTIISCIIIDIGIKSCSSIELPALQRDRQQDRSPLQILRTTPSLNQKSYLPAPGRAGTNGPRLG